MVKVENQETLRLLTRQFMKKNRGRNVVAVAAIILTTLLFTTLFTGMISMVLTRMEADKKQYMLYSHAYIQDLTEEEGKKIGQILEDSAFVERFGTAAVLGEVSDSRFSYPVEIRYGDRTGAEGFGCVPTHGEMPREPGEIAVSTLVLDTLGLPYELGEEIVLPIRWAEGGIRAEHFRLCGYWEVNKTDKAQFALVSEQILAELPSIRISQFCFVWYRYPWNMAAYTRKLSEISAGLCLEYGDFQLNPAYEKMVGEGGVSLPSAAVLISLILLSGYLIIYNIFNISIKNDIKTYGLLKNVGTTGRQLKQIVRMQAWRLSAVGVPMGLLLGYGAGVWMMPVLNADLERGRGTALVYPYPLAILWIFLASAFFALFTVYLSGLQACRTVEKVSPVEALRMAENGTGEKIRNGGGNGSSGGNTWRQMGMSNVMRNWKKGLAVMVSIGISLVTVNCMFMMARGYNLDPYKDIYLAADFQLDKMGPTFDYADTNGISGEIKKALEECPYSRETGYVYYSQEEHEMEPALQETWKRIIERYGERWGVQWQEVWRTTENTRRIRVNCIGISRSVFDKLEWQGMPGTWEEFCSGKYVIAGCPYYLNYGEDFYKAGDRFSMEYKSGVRKEYQVLGEANLPYSFDYPYVTLVSVKIFVPETEFINCTGNDHAMRAVMNAAKGQERELQQYLEQQVLTKDSTINLASVLDVEADFRRFVDKYYIIGGNLALVLALIGIMNFFNTSVTSILSRRRELAMLEAVGMTKKQILRMLMTEGCIYLGGALLLAVAFTYLCAGTLLKKTLGTAFFFELRVTAAPCLLMVPLLAVIAWGIPKLSFRYLSKGSVAERIRQ